MVIISCWINSIVMAFVLQHMTGLLVIFQTFKVGKLQRIWTWFQRNEMLCPTGVFRGPLLFLFISMTCQTFQSFLLCQFVLWMTLIVFALARISKISFIRMVYLWTKANKLSLNIDKTYFMLLKPKRFPSNVDIITIDGKQIMEVIETKFLRVIIDNTLNWKPHITHISKNVAKCIGIILKTRKVFNNETLSSLHFTLV